MLLYSHFKLEFFTQVQTVHSDDSICVYTLCRELERTTRFGNQKLQIDVAQDADVQSAPLLQFGDNSIAGKFSSTGFVEFPLRQLDGGIIGNKYNPQPSAGHELHLEDSGNGAGAYAAMLGAQLPGNIRL